MNLTGYVKRFGQYSFKEKPFNNVDAAIFATAVYSNLEVVAPSFFDHESKPMLFKNISAFDLTVVTAGQTLVYGNSKLIPSMCKSKRFGNVGIQYVRKIFSEENPQQFYACIFVIPFVGTYVAFRGTDASVVGWQENFEISIKTATRSQENAAKYLNDITKRTEGPLYVGGHSKGGNLTLYSIIYCDDEARKRIVKAYSFDGNGLRNKDYYSSKEYLEIKDRLIFIRPRSSYVGEMMYVPKEFLTVKSKNSGMFQHDSHSWIINKKTGDFCYLRNSNKKSLIRHWAFKEWLSNLSDEQKILMIDFLIKLFGGTRRTIFHFLFSFNKTITFLKTFNRYSKKHKKMLFGGIRSLSKCFKNAKKRYRREGKEKQSIYDKDL